MTDLQKLKALAKEAYELGDLINDGHNYLDAYNRLKLKLGEPGSILGMIERIEQLEKIVNVHVAFHKDIDRAGIMTAYDKTKYANWLKAMGKYNK